jgi:hypothetical protein
MTSLLTKALSADTTEIKDTKEVPYEYNIGYKIPLWHHNDNERDQIEKLKFNNELQILLKLTEYKKFQSKLRSICIYYKNFLNEEIKVKIKDIEKELKIKDNKEKELIKKDYIVWINKCLKNPIIPKKEIKTSTEINNYDESKGWYEKKKFCNNYINDLVRKEYLINKNFNKKIKHYIYVCCMRLKRKKEIVTINTIKDFLNKFFNEKIYLKINLEKLNEELIKREEHFCDIPGIKNKISDKKYDFCDNLKIQYKLYIFRQFKEDKKKEIRENNIKKLKDYLNEEIKRKEICSKYDLPYKSNEKPPGKIWLENHKRWKEWIDSDKKRINVISKLISYHEQEELVKDDCIKYDVEYIQPSPIVNPYDKWEYTFNNWYKESCNRVSKMNFKINKKKRIEEWNNLDEKKKKRFIEYFNQKREEKRIQNEKYKKEQERLRKAREIREINRRSNNKSYYNNYNKKKEHNEWVTINGLGSVSRKPGESRSEFLERVGDEKREYLRDLRG